MNAQLFIAKDGTKWVLLPPTSPESVGIVMTMLPGYRVSDFQHDTQAARVNEYDWSEFMDQYPERVQDQSTWGARFFGAGSRPCLMLELES